MTDRLDRIWTTLPEYLCGLTWLAAAAGAVLLTVSPSQAFEFTRAIGMTATPLQLPDLAVGFLVAVFGVLLPYAIAVVFGPLSFVIFGFIQRRFQPVATFERLKDEHVTILLDRLQAQLNVPAFASGTDDVVYLVLRQMGSPLISRLEHRAIHYNLQVYCSLPASLLAGLLLRGLVGDSWFSWVLCGAVAMTVYSITVYNAVRGLNSFAEEVLMAYLVTSSETAVDGIKRSGAA